MQKRPVWEPLGTGLVGECQETVYITPPVSHVNEGRAVREPSQEVSWLSAERCRPFAPTLPK